MASTTTCDILSLIQQCGRAPPETQSYTNVVDDLEGMMLYVECHLAKWLNDESLWMSLYVDYEEPHLLRLYTNVSLPNGRKIRVMLHYFLLDDSKPTESFDMMQSNLYHPHPWASIMKIITGSYKQDLGLTTAPGIDSPPPEMIKSQVLKAGNVYQMAHPWLWHRVKPLEKTSTIMITYIPPVWDQEKLPPRSDLRVLTSQETSFMFDHFKSIYN